MKDSERKSIADRILSSVKEEAKKMYEISGYVSVWRVSRNLGLSHMIAKSNLIKLGYFEKSIGSFVLKADREKAKVRS